MAYQQHPHTGCNPIRVKASLPELPQGVQEAAQTQGGGASGWGYKVRPERAAAPPCRCKCRLWRWGPRCGAARQVRAGPAQRTFRRPCLGAPQTAASSAQGTALHAAASPLLVCRERDKRRRRTSGWQRSTGVAEADLSRVCGQVPAWCRAQACSGRLRRAVEQRRRCAQFAMRHSRSARLVLARRRGGPPFLLAPPPYSLVWLLLVRLLCVRRRLIGAAWQRLADLNQLPHSARIQMFRGTTRVQECGCCKGASSSRSGASGGSGGGSGGRRRH